MLTMSTWRMRQAKPAGEIARGGTPADAPEEVWAVPLGRAPRSSWVTGDGESGWDLHEQERRQKRMG